MEDDDNWVNQEELIDFPVDATTIDEDASILIDAMSKADFWLPPTSRDSAGSSVSDVLLHVDALCFSNEAKGAQPCPSSNTFMSSDASLSLPLSSSQIAASTNCSGASASLLTTPVTPTNDKGPGSMVPSTHARTKSGTKRKVEELLKALPMRPLSAFSFYFRFEKHRIETICTDRCSSDVESVMDQQLEFRRLLLHDTGSHDHGERLHSAVSFSSLVKCIAKSWSALPAAAKSVFGEMAIRDRDRYILEMAQV